MLKGIVFVLICLSMFACAPASKQSTPMPAFTPPPPEHVVDQKVENPGSLFDPNQASYLFTDNRARRVGDIVVVNVVETVTAKNKATTKSEKDSSINLGVQNLFDLGHMRALPLGSIVGAGPNIGPRGTVGATPMVKAGSVSKFTGNGETKRESDISASVAARVVKVLNGGILQIEGARQIRVNGETQIIVVRGLVRSRDISPDNSVSSNYLADAHIEIYGQGILADKQKPGWLTRILDHIWPF
ncbi:flagellar basal body L-ring protein FlgH [Desulfohalobiaceae bacterium Ax17]|jgi:flagellar L-ring protein precursor FlgH|uniref:flagellar basal body L-ring protein FlgH n=1 Tax=Desulfovulcanus ferrireducens TaxID=2831190 RepID=UPI00207BBE18|nr:flagellar basal body L-ring protein FlgH [Desulfovulcanus ferrireducens]MBT8763786.1 flagellar basal body L-ring protein FlgH [Desulfovulcanus ferrireducens]